jgi:hypothetical protein
MGHRRLRRNLTPGECKVGDKKSPQIFLGAGRRDYRHSVAAVIFMIRPNAWMSRVAHFLMPKSVDISLIWEVFGGLISF